MTTITTDIVFGEKYRDTQTSIEGIATAIYFFQYGCERVTLEFKAPDGELKEYTFDAPRLEHIETGLSVRATRTGGPDKSVNAKRQAPKR